jgi:replicative DNA helicase
MSRSTDISPLTILLARIDSLRDVPTPPDTITTGFPGLDRVLAGGFRRGDLVVLGGDVGSGKSALSLALALRASATTRTAVFSAEMVPERIYERMLAIEGRVRIDDLRRGQLDDATRAGLGSAVLRHRDHLPIVDCVPPTVAELEGHIAGIPDLSLVVVDSLHGLLRGERHPDEEAAAAIASLKSLALRSRTAILTTCPLPGLAARPDPRPTLDDFGALGAIRNLADVVLTLFRDEMYHPAPHLTGGSELHVRKNRNGALAYVDLYFHAAWLRFEDMLDPDL